MALKLASSELFCEFSIVPSGIGVAEVEAGAFGGAFGVDDRDAIGLAPHSSPPRPPLPRPAPKKLLLPKERPAKP
jgi:hypothetical protein